MGEVNGTFIHNGQPTNGATAKLWQYSQFGGTPPEYDDAEPGGGQQGGSVTTGTTYGGDGAYRFTSVPDGEYYVSCEYDGHRVWQYVNVEIIDDILTTAGDLLVRGSSDPERLAASTESYFLKIVSGVPAWAALSYSFTESIAEYNVQITAADGSYYTEGTDTIPGTALIAGAYGMTTYTSTQNIGVRITLNGVSKGSATASPGATVQKGIMFRTNDASQDLDIDHMAASYSSTYCLGSAYYAEG
jgi:hypothetical protein